MGHTCLKYKSLFENLLLKMGGKLVNSALCVNTCVELGFRSLECFFFFSIFFKWGDFQQFLFIFNYVHVSASVGMYTRAQVFEQAQRGFRFPKLE